MFLKAMMKALDDLGPNKTITSKQKKQIKKLLGIKSPADTLVFSTEYAPPSRVLEDLREAGAITAREKRKIEKALSTGHLIPGAELKQYFDSVRANSPLAQGEGYTKRYFSKPIDLGAGKKAIFSIYASRSKKYKGGKAMGCATITFFSKKGHKWSLEDTICYEMY